MVKIKGSYRSRKFFLTSLAVLAAVPVARVGDVQLLELFLLLHFTFLAACFVLAGFRCRATWPWRRLGIPYGIFVLLTLLLALASLRFRFYPPPDLTPLKAPFILSVARVTELALGAFYMIYLASILRNEPDSRLYAMRAYFWAGFASAVYSLLSYPFLFATNLELGVYKPDFRTRGGFNEGGPYGLYLLSVVIVGMLLVDRRGLSKRKLWAAGVIFFLALVGSQSKAAFLACGVLLLLNLILSGSVRQKVALAGIAVIFGAVIWTMTPVSGSLIGYVNAYETIQEFGGAADERQAAGFGGRVGAAILVPRMIAAHPITGIGLGNYSLLRNAPDYLQGLPALDTWELPGLGLVGYIGELGIPLFAYLVVLLIMPAWMTRRRFPVLAFILAIYQPLAHIFGVQLNFYYPWICTGFALSIPELSPVPERAATSSIVEGTQVKRLEA